MLRVLAIVALTLSFTACDTDVVDRDLTMLFVGDLSQDPAALVGTWRLLTITGPGDCAPSCQETVPASARQRSETLTFSRGGTFERSTTTQRGTTERAGRYQVSRAVYGGGIQSEYPVLFLDGQQEDFGLEGDRLYLDSRSVDGELLEYVRR
ncbi:hypothetical protein [Rubrivirga sp.]|uniref:hypothetical protein n=1 Tax=Rubrivirga sp. TaxID=1885344 RepID=UPI003C765A9A